jgi:ankyrin repeat protein
MIRLLVSAGAKVDARDKLGFTPLFIAVGEGEKTKVQELLNSGASPNSKIPTDANTTALHLACSWERLEIIKVLADVKDIEINARDEHGKTPLDYAMDAANDEIVSFLKLRGAK